jgi:sugar lactone lactonase YvrE
MRRFLTLVCLLCLAVPAGISVSGCYRNPAANYCNGAGYGMKITDVATILIQPATTGISMAFGQTRQLGTPRAYTCKTTLVDVPAYNYGSTNIQWADISPGGNICAGTWNRNTGGGIANYTICSPPNPLPSTGGLPYGTAWVTASAQSVSSNAVEVYVHPQVTSISLVTTPLSGTAQQCYSQSHVPVATLDAQACYADSNNQQVLLCAPSSVTGTSTPGYACPLPAGVSSVPNCTSAIGTLSYSVGNSLIASTSTNTTTNQVTITANQPGTTAITASVALSGSSAGYFSTCPPKSISVTLANGETAGTITQGVTQNLITIVTDTNGNPITGTALDYQSTDPIDISVNSSGAITTAFPGVASVYAVCQPSNCNPSPINEVGLYGTGLSVSSNPVIITTPGTASDFAWFSAPGQSLYFSPVELLSGTVGSPVRLPYVPNSMAMDRLGNNLYFGSLHELMVYNTTTNALTAQNASVPGVVLAVSPTNAQLLINDQVRQLFYIYNVSGGSPTTFGGMGNAAAWTPDAKTLYITDSAALNDATAGITGHTDTLYAYNVNTGWTTYALPCSVYDKKSCPNPSIGAQSLAIAIPSVGAFLSGSDTVDHTWCPTGTVGDYASMSFYPQPTTDSVAVETDVLAATTDGQHILGAAVTGGVITLSDIGVNIPTAVSPAGALTPISCPMTTNSVTGVETLSALSAGPVLDATLTLDPSKANATAVNRVVPSPVSNLAFITYTGSTPGAQLPYYVPGSGANYVPLAGGAAVTAPLAGAFTPDDKLFFVSTAGDNMIHYIDVPTLTDKQQISPNLPACTPVSAGGNDLGCTYSGSGAIVPATAIAVKPRATT